MPFVSTFVRIRTYVPWLIGHGNAFCKSKLCNNSNNNNNDNNYLYIYIHTILIKIIFYVRQTQLQANSALLAKQRKRIMYVKTRINCLFSKVAQNYIQKHMCFM